MLEKPHFWVFWAKKADFGPFLAKKGPFSNFQRKSEKTSLFYSFFFSFFNTKNQKILMRRFSGKSARTNGRTDERTEVNPKEHQLRRETNKGNWSKFG